MVLQINACVRQTTSTTWEVYGTKQIAEHNHDVGSDVYQTYHEARQVSDEDVVSTVRVLHRCGANRKRILEYIMENSTVEPTMKDEHNFVQRLKKESYNYPTMETRIEHILSDFSDVKGNLSRLDTNDEAVAECISIQTRHMRSMFANFPEVLMIDVTHGTNVSHYKLFSFMSHDALGKGQHVQHCLFENERKETLSVACQQFKEGCATHDDIAVIIIDKDFTEIGALEEEFPHARILLCHFHVVKYLQEKVKYKMDAWTKSEMKRLIRLLSDVKRQLWFDYFDANWTSCKEMWTAFSRGNAPHLGNRTNNRIESGWGKLRTLVDRSTILDDCVVSIFFWQTVKERKWSNKMNRVDVSVNAGLNEDLNGMSLLVSCHALEYVSQQYEFAVRPDTKYKCYPVGPYVMMQYVSGDSADVPEKYTVNVENWLYSCMFYVTRLLACRHMIYYRKQEGCVQLLVESMVHHRWLVKSYRLLQKSLRGVDDVENQFETRVMKERRPGIPKSENDKFRELFTLDKSIAEVGCEWNISEHDALTSALLKFLTVVKSGTCPVVEQARGSLSSEASCRAVGTSELENDTESCQREKRIANNTETGHESRTGETVDLTQTVDSELSPQGRAVKALVNDMDSGCLDLTEEDFENREDQPEQMFKSNCDRV
ncbi:hypothetical protein F442_02249 [Phytophthora nicotianae P10297]|uniref:ZSWIM1/3 RNaseH-like domain-containing protein n=1 Tax=Phytophthora nicotianae P10297 TaxID=1317064 RepID=W3A2N6_PHYNI|nr:hypothetical protein F442_02249 [Phytophthora nicotianae P10297]